MNYSLTIITSTFNCVEDIKKTADNISFAKNAGYNIQWIIADGGSTDGTIEKLREHAHLVSDMFSGPDRGIYDAWNKALKFVRSDWVMFLGAGDQIIVDNLVIFLSQLEKVDINVHRVLYGDVNLVDGAGNVLKVHSEVNSTSFKNRRPDLPCHQGVFHHYSLFSELGNFDSSYKIAADSKFLLLSMSVTKFLYMPCVIASMLNMGVSNNPAKILNVRAELIRLKNDVGFFIPLSSILWFDCCAFLKFSVMRVVGERTFYKLLKLYCFLLKKDYLY
jgi:glycosyltransferase involved in cell wall biosynthesis